MNTHQVIVSVIAKPLLEDTENPNTVLVAQ